MEILISRCAWCETEEQKKQPPLPGFGITHGVCEEHKLTTFIKAGALSVYLSHCRLTAEDLILKYLERTHD